MKPVIVVALTYLALLPAETAQVQLAWWLETTFEATESTIESIPVAQLDRTWIAASPLREAVLNASARTPGERLSDHDAAFELEGDFDRDGKQEKALVGVYRSANGATGGFVLILQRNGRGMWTRRALFKNPGGQFSALTIGSSGDLVWMFCLECDGNCAVKRTWRGYRLDCPEEP